MANVERLKEVREYIREHPEQHEQRFWAQKKGCGTALCLAGTAALLAGQEFEWSADRAMDIGGKTVTGFLKDGGAISIFAQDWLELTPAQVEYLFYEWDEERALDNLDDLIKECENSA